MKDNKVFKHSIEINGYEMKYARFGAGEQAVVIIPGLNLGSVVDSADAVALQYKTVADRFTVYLFDRKNISDSNYSIYDMASDTAEAMKILDLKSVYLFGASQGGMISQVIAARFPELVSKLIICSSASAMNENAYSVINNWAAYAENGNIEMLCKDFLLNVYSESFADKYGEAITEMYSNIPADELIKFSCFAKACFNFDITSELSKIKCPSLVIGAENDKIFGKEEPLRTAGLLVCECYIYPAPYGHAVYDEAEDFTERLYEFFIK